MKKTLYVLFVLVFLLSLGNLSAQAQAQSTSFAYVPLISPQSGSSVPVEIQARQAFDTLAPQLLEAQAKGQIVRFEPDFAFGLLKVEYQAGLDLAASLAVNPGAPASVFNNSKSALNYTQVSQSLRSPSAGVTVVAPWIEIPLYNDCFSGGNMGANDYYKVTLNDSNGRRVASTDGYVKIDGSFDTCFDGVWYDMVPGYAFSFKLFDPSGTTLLNTYSATIADLRVTSFDIPNKTVYGTAPKNSLLNTTWRHATLDASDTWIATLKDITASSTGVWHVKFNTASMRGGDDIEINWSAPGTVFSFYTYVYAPFASCALGKNYCGLYGIPGKTALISIYHKKTYNFTGQISPWGYYYANIYSGQGRPIFLAAGDTFSGTGVKIWTLPTLTANPNYTSNLVTGKAPNNKYLQVELDDWTNGHSNQQWIKSDAAGNYSMDFSSYFHIQTTDTLEVYVGYTNINSGNFTSYTNYIAP